MNSHYRLKILLICLIHISGLLIFLVGFFPGTFTAKTKDFGMKIANETPHEMYSLEEGPIKRLVFIVIDALRSDFIFDGESFGNSMPFLQRLRQERKACAYGAFAHSPTVTMPRIKSLVSGTVPSFADVVFNMGTSEMRDDSFINQLKNTKKPVVFYGDDTWLRLFPKSFKRSDGTASFFVNDYTEVDGNVTRHIDSELSRSDWTVMILHYLGLDHIGHIGGPKSSLVPPKLHEMDQIIEKIYSRFKKEDTAIIVCGDHGISDSGSHGGSSAAETQVPLVFILDGCSEQKDDVLQIDMAATVSALLGLSFPDKNLGMIIQGVSTSHLFTQQKKYETIRENVRSLLQKTAAEDPAAFEEIAKAEKAFADFSDSSQYNSTIEQLFTIGRDLSLKLTSNNANFDLVTIAMGLSLMLQVLLISFADAFIQPVKLIENQIKLLWIFLLMSLGYLLSFWLAWLNLSTVFQILFIFTSWLILVKYCSEVYKQNFKKRKSGPLFRCLFAGVVLHAVSLGSSSFVEEEHQTFYFFWNTFCCLLLSHMRNFSWKSRISVLLAMFLQRIARSWNQTGDKWANHPDIEDFLVLPENTIHLTISAIAGSSGTFCWIYKTQNLTKFQLISVLIANFAILLYRTAVGSLYLGFSYPQSTGVFEAWIVYAAILLLLVSSKLSNYQSVFTTAWISLINLLRRPHNLGLLPLQLAHYSLLEEFLKQTDITEYAVAHYWLGMVWYFQQGNSNSFSRVDISAGYVGLKDHSSLVSGLLICCATYAGPVLGFILGLKNLKTNKINYTMVYILIRIFITAFFAIICSALRYHLFIWSVFSPKLLYEAVYSFIVVFLSILCCLFI